MLVIRRTQMYELAADKRRRAHARLREVLPARVVDQQRLGVPLPESLSNEERETAWRRAREAVEGGLRRDFLEEEDVLLYATLWLRTDGQLESGHDFAYLRELLDSPRVTSPRARLRLAVEALYSQERLQRRLEAALRGLMTDGST